MINNTEQHISSKAVDVVLDPSTTNFPATTNDVQKMAELIQPHAIGRYEDMKATETKMGILRIATESEVLAGTVSDAIVTPKTLQAKWVRPDASETVKGLVRYATNAERLESAASASIGINTIGLWDMFRTKAIGSTTKAGTLKLSTITIGQQGTDSTTATSPDVVKAMIDKFAVTANSGATELTSGIVKISPSPVINSALHNGVAVSPKGFIETRATQSRVGTVKMATQAESNARTATDVAISPATLPIGSSTQWGIVALTDTPVSGATNKALSSHGATSLVSKSGGTMTGALITPNLYLTNPQDGSPNAAVRFDWVSNSLQDKQNQIDNKTTKGSDVVFRRSDKQLIFNASPYGGLKSGDFNMTQPWWNFDGIIVISSGDDGRHMKSSYFSKTELSILQNNFSNGWWITDTDSTWWVGRFNANGTYFHTAGENCVIWHVWGVNDVYATT
ncbi:short tail fibers protein [Aeromonas phage AS-szw]|uniref:Short tail fibers protein n=1 Tax=Aeromonas phage AS-szw TaxID=2026114 RepID=A0A291LDC7_9CAUD|nr:short tail fibers protein [Aeromonas phage AS-szw]